MDEESGPDADPHVVARTIVLRQLDHSPRTRRQLEVTLRRRKVPHDVAESVLDRLEELGLVDDQVFADMLVRSRTTAKRLSRRALRAELTAKGVATDIIDDVLHQVTDDDERRMAGELVQRRLPAMAHLEPVVRQRRLAALLARKGHSSATIRATLRDYESDLK